MTGLGHGATFVPKAGLEFIVSRFLAWCFNHYTKLALLPKATRAVNLKILSKWFL